MKEGSNIYKPKHQNSTDSSGFTSTWLVVILVVASVITISGWYVWHKDQKATNTNSTTSVNQQASKSDQKDKATSINYLTLKEYGIRIPINDSIKDLILGSIRTSNYSQDDKVVAIIAPVLDGSWTCTSDTVEGYKGTIGSISITSQAKRAGPYDPLAIKKIGAITYGYEQGGSNCTQSEHYQKLVEAFKTQFQRLEAY